MSLPLLVLAFALAAGAVWAAGSWLARSADALTERFGLGHALGGLVILAVATNLPEVAICLSAAHAGHLDLITGNILGSIAAQTAVVALLDALSYQKGRPLTYRAASLELVLEGILVMAMLAVVVMGTQVPPLMLLRFTTPSGFLILLGWAVGIGLLAKARNGLPWQAAGEAPGGQRTKRGEEVARKSKPLRRPVAVFAMAATVTLVGGVVLERTGERIAGALGMSGVVFGATALAFVGALPEFSSCLTAVRSGDDKLALSDVFGGHIFLPVLFVVGTAIAGRTILPGSSQADVYLTALGILMTAVYLYGLIFRPQRQILRMGVDSLIVLLLYIVGMVGLVSLSRTSS